MSKSIHFGTFKNCAYLLFFILWSCGGGRNDCKYIEPLFYNKELSAELLKDYVSTTSNEVSNTIDSNKEVKIYVDKSSGINEAFSSALGGITSRDLMGEILNNYRDAVFYGVLDDIQTFDLGGADPSNYFVNGANYEKIDGLSADLSNALDQITNYNGLSFFVTDAEQFDGTRQEITLGAWAIDPLRSWIEAGNTIHFWITDFEVNNRDRQKIRKHLFFMAFVPADISEGKAFKDLVKSLNNINPIHLELSKTSWKINTPEWPQQSTGLDENLLKEGVFEKAVYQRNFNNTSGGYEFMSIQFPIMDEVLIVEGALTRPQFYRDLTLDLSNNLFFDITDLEIDVFDVTEDLNRFAQFDEISNNPPNTVKDLNTQETILNPEHPYTCYYMLDDAGNPFMVKDFVYEAAYSEKRLKELFEFDGEIFRNSMKDDASEAEIGIRLHKNFNENDPILNNEYGYNIIRVDFKISEFDDKTVKELNYFSWPSMWKPTERNTGFGKSVEQVIKSTQPRGKILHSLFIKFIKA